MERSRRLVHTGHTLQHLYGPGPWIDTKFFTPDPDGAMTAREAVEALLAEPEYRDHYCSPENDSAGGPLHGPYWADRITFSDFTAVGAAECEAILSAWRHEWGTDEDTPEERARADATLDAALALARRATHRLYLRDMRSEAEHDWGWVLGIGGFHEFVLVDADGKVSLVVASDD